MELFFDAGKRRRKNISQKIRNGTILQTRDEYFAGQKQYRKPGYANKGNYRKSVVVDSNRNDELAVVKLRSNGEELIEVKSKYKPIVEVFDNNNKRIRAGRKFIPNGDYLSKQNVAIIKKDCFNNPKYKYLNKKKMRRLKGRK